jgi:hypothetical protein
LIVQYIEALAQEINLQTWTYETGKIVITTVRIIAIWRFLIPTVFTFEGVIAK